MDTALDKLKNGLKTDVELSFLKQKDVDRIVWYIDTYYKQAEKSQIEKAVNDTYSTCQVLAEGKMPTPIDGQDYYEHFYSQPLSDK